jgi:hypothetical protein
MNLFNKIGNNEERSSISFKLRKKRFENFVRILNISKADRIIDIGGYEQIWEGSGLEKQVTLLNLKFPEKKNSKFNNVEGDACNMKMIADKSFDVAFSNSVIEHVGNFQRQKDFASEVIRVSSRYWIQTPYKYFPIEPHVLFPFFDLLPMQIKKMVALNWKYSHFRRLNMDVMDELSRLRLLTRKEMKTLFSGSSIYSEKILGMTKSITAYKS